MMFTVSLLKIKFLTLLSMVFMGIFSRLVLGFPLLIQTSSMSFHSIPQTHQFPDGGNRTSLRFMPTSGHTQKRRRALKNGSAIDEELCVFQSTCDDFHFDFIGEVIEQGNDDFQLESKLISH